MCWIPASAFNAQPTSRKAKVLTRFNFSVLMLPPLKYAAVAKTSLSDAKEIEEVEDVNGPCCWKWALDREHRAASSIPESTPSMSLNEGVAVKRFRGVAGLLFGHEIDARVPEVMVEPLDVSAAERSILRATDNPRRYHFSQSMLKSIMQKNVRLQRPEAAVRCGVQLMFTTDFMDLLRRVTIIVIEDAILHPMFPVLVWMVSAGTKGFSFTKEHVNLTLRVLYDVAAIGVKDCLQGTDGKAVNVESGDAERVSEGNVSHNKETELCMLDPLRELSETQRSFVQTLLVRACLGGM